MPTPLKQRTRISLEDKVKLIEDSKRPGFNRKYAMEKYGIGRNAVSTIWSCKECDEKLCAFCYKAHIRVKLTQNRALSKS